jgi:hypothetical protein
MTDTQPAPELLTANRAGDYWVPALGTSLHALIVTVYRPRRTVIQPTRSSSEQAVLTIARGKECRFERSRV